MSSDPPAASAAAMQMVPFDLQCSHMAACEELAAKMNRSDVSRMDIRAIRECAPQFVSVGVFGPNDPYKDPELGACIWGLPTASELVDHKSMRDASTSKTGSHLIILKHVWLDAAHLAVGMPQYLDLVRKVDSPKITHVSILSNNPAEIATLTGAGWVTKGGGIQEDDEEWEWLQIKI